MLESPLKKDPLSPESLYSDEIEIISANGFHARPAAQFSTAARKFTSQIRLHYKEKTANVKSLVSLMGLALDKGSIVRLEADGADAQEAIAVLSALLGSDMEGKDTSSPKPKEEMSATVLPPKDAAFNRLTGIPASSGIAVGSLCQLKRAHIEVAEKGLSFAEEQLLFDKAMAETKKRLERVRAEAIKKTGSNNAAIFDAHQGFLADPDLLEAVHQAILGGKSAAYAWQKAYEEQVRQLEAVDNELFAARADDLKEIGFNVLLLLAGVEAPSVEYAPGTILLAENLGPSDTMGLDPERVVGFCTAQGGATSHVAILARSLGIPAIVGMGDVLLNQKEGQRAILDGNTGILTVDPEESETRAALEKLQKQKQERAINQSKAVLPANMLDGECIEVAANISSLEEARQAVLNGCDGVGLLRSEFMFLDRKEMPSEEEQSQEYMAIAQTLGKDRPLIVRTLDVGGDKPLEWLPQPAEENPFLGVRGIRLCLQHPEILEVQLRAILRAAPYCRLHVMFPMIATLDELKSARRILEEQKEKLGIREIQMGIMVEVPSAALLAEHFAEAVDFFSIGTNDLTQYTLAADRGNGRLGTLADALDPAVIRLIHATVKGALTHNRWVGVCGGIAGDPLAVPLLIGLGIRELSVSIPSIPAIKAQIRELNLSACKELAEQVLTLSHVGEVRKVLSRKESHS